MQNILSLRLSLSAAIMLGVTSGFLAFVFLNFPYNVAVITISVLTVILASFYVARREKAARFDIFYSTVREFGSLISFNDHFGAFDRNGTRFECHFPKGKYNFLLRVSFCIPHVYQKFSIQHDALIKKFLSNCEFVESSPMSGEIILHSQNREFLLKLLENKNIQNEIYNYPPRTLSRFSIVFDDGKFEIELTPLMREEIAGFYKVCRTAVVFHDEIKKLAKTIRR